MPKTPNNPIDVGPPNGPVEVSGSPARPIEVRGSPLGPTKSIDHRREETRAYLALALTGIFAVEVLAALATFVLPQQLGINPASLASAKDMLSLVFGPTVALVGSAIGFYFGAEGKKSSAD